MSLFFASSVQNKVEKTKIKYARVLKKTASLLTIVPLLIMLTPASVFADANYSVTQFPSTGADGSGIGLNSVGWANPDRITSNNNNNATATLVNPCGSGVPNVTAYTHFLKASNFGFAIPAGATINGISASINRHASNNNQTPPYADYVRDGYVKLVKADGSYIFANYTSGGNWATTNTVANYGNNSDTWGDSWTPADINSSNFGVVLSAFISADTCFQPMAAVDSMSISVTYTPDTTPPAPVNTLWAMSPTKTPVLNWAPVGDADLAGYHIYRDGNYVGAVPNGAPTTYTDNSWLPDGPHSYFVQAFDLVGNGQTAGNNTIGVLVDNTFPTTTGSIVGGTLGTNGWYTSNVTYALHPADAVSGVQSTNYCLDLVGNCSSGPSYSSPITLSVESASNHVRFSSIDFAGNIQPIQDSGTIRIDKTAPTISLPPSELNPIIEATGPFTSFTFHPTVTDNLDPAPILTSNLPTGSLFPLGTTVVTWTAKDSAGNTSTATRTVTIKDTKSPTFDPFNNITVEATSPAGAVVTFAPTATDVTGTPTVTCDPSSGSAFALGVRVVECTATDSSGNKSTMSFGVTVKDTTPPVISPVADIVREATSPSGAIVTFTNPTATDLVDGSVTVNCTPPSGSLFPLGLTSVSCSAMDSHSNLSATSFVVNVVDTTAPNVTSVSSDGDVYNLSTLSPHAIKVTFNEDISNTPYINVHSVPVGTQTVTNCGDSDAKTFCFDYSIPAANEETHTIYISNAQDMAGNTMIADNSHTFSVDTIAPTITGTFYRQGAGDHYAKVGDIVQVSFVASEPVTPPDSMVIAGHAIPSYQPQGGNDFYIYYTMQPSDTEGPLTYSLTAHDAAGNSTTVTDGGVTFDKTAPTATVAYSPTAPTTGDVTATITPSETVTINGGSATHTFTDNDTFTFDFQDAAGNTGSAVATVSNIDRTAPVITIAPYNTDPTNQDITVTASTNEGTLNTTSHIFTANGSFDFVATDLAGNSSTTTVTITNIDKTAPVITLNGGDMSLTIGQAFSDPGASTNDGSAVTASGSVNTALAGIYLIRYSSTDSAGNVAKEVIRTVAVNPAASGIVGSDAYTEIFQNGDFGSTTSPTDTNTPSKGTQVEGTQTNQGNNKNTPAANTKSKSFNWNWVWYSLGALILLGGGLWYALAYRKSKNPLNN
jgi:hypothetical protein